MFHRRPPGDAVRAFRPARAGEQRQSVVPEMPPLPPLAPPGERTPTKQTEPRDKGPLTLPGSRLAARIAAGDLLTLETLLGPLSTPCGGFPQKLVIYRPPQGATPAARRLFWPLARPRSTPRWRGDNEASRGRHPYKALREKLGCSQHYRGFVSVPDVCHLILNVLPTPNTRVTPSVGAPLPSSRPERSESFTIPEIVKSSSAAEKPYPTSP